MMSAEAISGFFADHNVVEGARAAQAAPSTLRQARESFEKAFIIQKLDENGWNISRTAELIEVERGHLHRKIRNYGINANKPT